MQVEGHGSSSIGSAHEVFGPSSLPWLWSMTYPAAVDPMSSRALPVFSGTEYLSPATAPACRIRLRLGFASTALPPFFDVGTYLTPKIRVHISADL